MTERKWKKHRASKWEFKSVKGKSGEKEAKRDIERKLGRSLVEGHITRHTRTQWVFCEPMKATA